MAHNKKLDICNKALLRAAGVENPEPQYEELTDTATPWQSIETAPKDGTEVLLYYPHVDTVIRGAYVPQNEGDWESGIQDWDDWTSDNDFIIAGDPSYAPTHWMSVPKPPTE